MQSTYYWKHFLLIVLSFFAQSCYQTSFLRGYSAQRPAKVKYEVILTDTSQIVVIDSLCIKLASRLNAFSNERKDFIIAGEKDEPDFIFRIHINELFQVSDEKGMEMEKKRNRIYNKYDKKVKTLEEADNKQKLGIASGINVSCSAVAIIEEGK